MKAVFDTCAGSGYDDDVSRRYHFPNRYLTDAQNALGDWIIYREPRRGGGREGYVAVARVVRIESDPNTPGHSYAWVADYRPFDRVVHLRKARGFYETVLDRVLNPARIGTALQGKSIRTVPDADFGAITRAGFQDILDPDNAPQLLDLRTADEDVLDLINAPPVEQERRIAQYQANRKIRDAAFRKTVCDAYDYRCTVSDLRIINGGGRAEVQAAHIWSIATGGPNVVHSGLALSATVHWLFDRHLISLTDEVGFLVSHNKVPTELQRLFARHLNRIHLPSDPRLWPRPAYVSRHREQFAAT